MTMYRLYADPDTGKPCMIASPNGPWMCSGEVTREIGRLKHEITSKDIEISLMRDAED